MSYSFGCQNRPLKTSDYNHTIDRSVPAHSKFKFHNNNNNNNKMWFLTNSLKYSIRSILQTSSHSPFTLALCTAVQKTLNIPDDIKYPDGNHKFKLYLDRLKQTSTSPTSKRASLVSSIIEDYENRSTIVEQYTELSQEMYNEPDAELQALAADEFSKLKRMLSEIDESLVDQLIALEEDDANSISSIVLEVSAGVGGQEAMLFAGDIFRMYANFAKYKTWTHNLLSQSDQSSSILIKDAGAYETLRYEAGIHRVQRVPETEKSGRIHTSTAVVMITPFDDDIDIQINRNDLKIEQKRAQGPGGQSVNKSESAIRLTHLPTGIVIVCQDERTATKNQKIAMNRLHGRLYEMEFKKQRASTSSIRKAQSGSRERNEKIRTYNFNQHRVTDHRLGTSGGSIHNLEDFLNGNDCLEEFIERVQRFQRKQKLNEILSNE